MFESIQTLIGLLPSLASSHVFATSDWLEIARLYHSASQIEQSNLLDALSAHTGIDKVDLTEGLGKLHLNTDTAFSQQLLAAWQTTQEQLSEAIQIMQSKEVVRYLPLQALHLSRADWQALLLIFNSDQRQNLTRAYFINALANLKGIDFYDMIAILNTPQPARAVKKMIIDSPESTSGPTFKRRRFEREGEPFVVAEEETQRDIPGTISRPLIPVTPERGARQAAQTPGGKKYRFFGQVGSQTLYQPVTPDRQRSQVSRQAAEHLLTPKLKKRSDPISFVATKAKMNQRKGQRRPVSQRTVMGATCRDIFISHGDEYAVEAKGHQFHWTHLVAHVLGGDQDSNNLVPATARANYTILEVVEDRIANVLTDNQVEKVDIKIVVTYPDEQTVIPEMLRFDLNWQEQSENGLTDNSESFDISTLSHRRLSRQQLQALRSLRHSGVENEPPPSPLDLSF